MELLGTKITYRFHDQDILNVLFKNQIGLLDLRFNVMSQNIYFGSARNCRWLYGMKKSEFYSSKAYKAALKNPAIYHLTSVPFLVRPWIKGSNHPVCEYYNDIKRLDSWLEDFSCTKTFSRRQKILQKICAHSPRLFSPFLITVLHKFWFFSKRKDYLK